MSYLRKGRCPECRQPHWFRNWVGQFCAKSTDGLNISDFDLLLHRFKRIADRKGERTVEHIMVAEVKVGTEKVGNPQKDSFSVFNAALCSMMPWIGKPIGIKGRPAFIVNGDKKIVWHGVHLCRVPFEESPIVGPFFWDNKLISFDNLRRVINFDNDPNRPSVPLDIDRRHKPGMPAGELFQSPGRFDIE